MVDGTLKGIDWSFEHGTATMLRLSADPAVCGRLVPHQLRMMQEQAVHRLLPVAAGEEEGRLVLHYELTGKRRLVQWLYAEPPAFRLVAELAHQLVRTVAECKSYMLQESGFLLHEDFLFADRRLTDFKLCYLPLEAAMDHGKLMPPVTEQLRRLLLRLLASVKEPLPAGIAPVFGLLSQEPYSIAQLEQAFRKLRYGGIGSFGKEESGGKAREEGGWERGLERVAGWWRTRKENANNKKMNHEKINNERMNKVKRKQERTKREKQAGNEERSLSVSRGSRRVGGGLQPPPASTEKTGLLARPSPSGEEKDMQLVFSCDGKTETRLLDADRFLIGRNRESVHYAIDREDVSRIHCEIAREEGGFAATDLGSLNGTLLNGQPMLPYKRYPLHPGDVLQVTRTAIRLAGPGKPADPGNAS